MEKNDIQSGGQDPVPKQLFSSLIYSTGHLVHPLTTTLQQTQTQFPKHQGKGRWIIGSIWSGSLLSPLCSVLITLNLQLRKQNMVWNATRRSQDMSQIVHSFTLGFCNWIIHNYLCMQRLLLIKCILLCLAGSLQKCKRVKSNFKKHQWGKKLWNINTKN